ncbi:MAG: ferrochelatase [Acidiferrobacterales bacterium]|nr:ferrochelatase [Acidiferrobacterales bacterium]
MPKFINHYTEQPDSRNFGVILANLGTPESPAASSVRRFLRQFLSDPRVVELPRLLWWLILNGVILVIRPSRSAAAYREVWTEDGSPLMVNANAQVTALTESLAHQGITDAQVRCAMRYGEPSLMRVMREFGTLGIDRVVVIPMYPQYSGSTTGSVLDDVGACTARLRRVPSLRFINGYADDHQYIESLRVSVTEHWGNHGRADHLVMSFHGLPQDFCDNGDPYEDQCRTTARLLARKLGLESQQWTICFQSRVGRQKWLEPYVDEVISDLPAHGIKSIEMICPGFSVDCLETLEEVNIGYRKLFLESGGDRFEYIPCLNDQPAHIEMLARLLIRSAADWIGE